MTSISSLSRVDSNANFGVCTTPTSIRDALRSRTVVPFVGIYDIFSARIVGSYFDTLFVSGFGFAASHYGLPDIGFGTWSDLAWFVQRLRAVLPSHLLLVDIDDGFGDSTIAAHTAKVLEHAGASGVVLEDQRRPRRCGHFEGKLVLDLDEFLIKLDRVLTAREEMFVVARTDTSNPKDAMRRVEAFAAAGADAVLVDGISSLDVVQEMTSRVSCPIAFNQIAGGKSPPCTLSQLQKAGASIVIYSTPALFAAQRAISSAMQSLQGSDGSLPQPVDGAVGVAECTALLNASIQPSCEQAPPWPRT